ncbi:hypothetical protein [Methylobacterium sp. WSM2598]|uniref:hypothetical protein n=1 Tax=Methylobacterium sp. WSM2598 TaxID=398261 RepID=UPI0003A5110E|nr:hypothetical protein [Methylobacterium sp. WSM2598]
MGHGGRREGAGRKEILDIDQRFTLFTRYERRVFDLKNQKTNDKLYGEGGVLEKVHECSETIDSYVMAKKGSAKYQTYLKRRIEGVGIGDGDHTIDEAYLDLQDQIHNVFGGARRVGLIPKRPYRFRNDVLKALAEEASKEFGVRVTPRRVRACVEEFRAVLRADEPDHTNELDEET